MREIKFRAWHFKLKKMFTAEEMTTDQMALLPDGHFANIHSVSTKLSWILSHEEMLPLQFTGLHDRTGREIWEGDILLTPGKFKMEVRIDNIGYGDPKFFNIGFDVCEVIGNIYENPELLGEK